MAVLIFTLCIFEDNCPELIKLNKSHVRLDTITYCETVSMKMTDVTYKKDRNYTI